MFICPQIYVIGNWWLLTVPIEPGASDEPHDYLYRGIMWKMGNQAPTQTLKKGSLSEVYATAEACIKILED